MSHKNLALDSFWTVRSDVSVGGAVKGLVKGFKSLMSPTNQTQQQQTVANPGQTQQPLNNTTNPTSNAGTLTITLPIMATRSAVSNQLSPGSSKHPSTISFPASGGTSDQGNNDKLDPFNGVNPISSSPIQSTSPGSSVPQILNNANQDPTSNTLWNGVKIPPRSPGGHDYTSKPDDSNTDAVPGSYPDWDPSENGDDGDGVLVGEVDAQSIGSFVYPPSIPASESMGVCKLEGCSNPTLVDSITDLESEYCSWKHQE